MSQSCRHCSSSGTMTSATAVRTEVEIARGQFTVSVTQDHFRHPRKTRRVHTALRPRRRVAADRVEQPVDHHPRQGLRPRPPSDMWVVNALVGVSVTDWVVLTEPCTAWSRTVAKAAARRPTSDASTRSVSTTAVTTTGCELRRLSSSVSTAESISVASGLPTIQSQPYTTSWPPALDRGVLGTTLLPCASALDGIVCSATGRWREALG